MESLRSKRRRLMQSYIPQRSDLPATFESLNDDTLTTVLEFVGNKSYATYAGINKHCKEIYLKTKGMTKETFLCSYAPLSVILDRIERGIERSISGYDSKLFEAVGKGVVLYNRRDVFEWILQERKDRVLRGICRIAGREGRIDLLDEVWNNIDEDDNKRAIFGHVYLPAASGGKLNVLKWIEKKGLSINEILCARDAAKHGHIHILQWLIEEKGLKLFGDLYIEAIKGGQLHVMRWLREQEVPFHKRSSWGSYGPFRYAARRGSLDILQWLHDEGCPWPEHPRLHENLLKPETREWLIANGYRSRIIRSD